MIPGIYSAATAMEQAAKRHELVAQNLAHLDMPGYRRVSMQQQTFESTLNAAQQDQFRFDSLGVASKAPSVDFTHGNFENTGYELDFAIQGEGFFAIDAPGETLYTRNGTFQFNGNGRLVTADGHPVAADSGSLTLPPGSSPAMLKVASDGNATVNGVSIGRIKTARFENPHLLESGGVTLYRAPVGVQAEDIEADILQGTREHSNVHSVHELVDMIAASRAHEAAQRAMNTITKAIEHHTDLRGG